MGVGGHASHQSLDNIPLQMRDVQVTTGDDRKADFSNKYYLLLQVHTPQSSYKS